VGEVGVHLQDEVGAAVEGAAEARQVGRAEAFLAGPVEDLDARVGGREAVGDTAGAVGRVVVDDEDPGVGGQVRAGRLHDRGDVRRLVVGREDQPGGPCPRGGFHRGDLIHGD
jgi:hypothetical protein